MEEGIKLLYMRLISNIYWKYIASPESYARHLGVHIGNGCVIATRNWSSEPYLVTIGNNVAVTRDVSIHTHGGGRIARQIYPDFDVFGKVFIDDGAYIGVGAQIMPGVRIGKGALVAAGSIVTKSVPAGMVVGGNPAKIICTVEEYINKNLKYNLGTKCLSSSEKKRILLSLPDEKFIQK